MLFTIKNFSLRVAQLWLLITLSGCTTLTSLMFYPLQNIPAEPSYFGFEFEEVFHQASDGTRLISWWLPAEGSPKGSVVVLHGNAQNISYHQMSVHWLVRSGYNVFLLGYRQYGKSEGRAILPDMFFDVHAGLDWVIDHQQQQGPIVLLGQSMGASLAVYGLASYAKQEKVNGLILDAGFDSYPAMAAQAMSRHWITWLLQLPAYTITDEYDPIQWIGQVGDKPLLMFHSPDDQTVPYDRGRHLYEQAQAPKTWVSTHGAHIATFAFAQYRQTTLEFIENLPFNPE